MNQVINIILYYLLQRYYCYIMLFKNLNNVLNKTLVQIELFESRKFKLIIEHSKTILNLPAVFGNNILFLKIEIFQKIISIKNYILKIKLEHYIILILKIIFYS